MSTDDQTSATQPEVVTPWQWVQVIRRARLKQSVKMIALLMSSYAEYDTGTRIFPGEAELIVSSQMSHKTVSAATRTLRDLGLIVRTRRGSGRGARRAADEYRLAIPDDLMTRVQVLSPKEFSEQAQTVRDRRRGTYKTQPTKDTSDLRTPERDAEDDTHSVDNSASAAPQRGRRNATDEDLRPAQGAAENPTFESSASPSEVRKNVSASPLEAFCVPFAGTPPNHIPTTTTNNQLVYDGENADGEDATGVDDDTENFDSKHPPPSAALSLPNVCRHGLRSRLRADGSLSCALCRREAIDADTVVLTVLEIAA